jgi:hypothetical protein
MHKRVTYNAIDDRRTARVACLRTPAYENVLSILALATIRGDKKCTASLHPTSRDGVRFESCLRVIHLQQIRFDRSDSLVVIHASRIQKSERVEGSKRAGL